ncbi:hypothetical protein ENUP19_0054G0077 [Entamoeba nuttalli]|uniref:DH domain-containing protein n=2 Tax=Entamoeba nuttalli TaxID=412467 RepID=A0ABQ0DCP6_9EUKA
MQSQQQPPLCLIFPYSPPYFSYSLDARKWTKKMLLDQLQKMGEHGLAYRCYLNEIEANQFFHIDNQFYEKYSKKMRLNLVWIERINKISNKIIENTAACVIQKAVRSMLYSKEEKRYLYCGNVVKEFITTESTYCEQLGVVENLIHQPLIKQEKPLLTPEQMKLIFGGVSVIYGVNTALLENLREKLSVYSQNSRFGRIVLTFTPLLRVYSDYCQIYPQISQLVSSMKVPHPFGTFYKLQMKQAPEHLQGFDLLSLLITPIQRLPRYRLLLKDLLKHLRPSDVDYEDVKKALDEIEKVTSFVNTQSKKQENLVTLKNSYLRLSFEETQLNRYFLSRIKLSKNELLI